MESKKERQEAALGLGVRSLARLFRRPTRDAEDDVYARLKEHARRLARDEHALTVGPTGLVHEAYVRLPTEARGDLAGNAGLICREMGRVAIDRARKRNAAKRGGGAEHAPLDGSEMDVAALRPEARIHGALDARGALEALGRVCPELREVVRLRHEVGLTEEQTAGVLGVSLRTVQRESEKARGMLRHILGEGPG